jgi:RNA-splicing ligase RtcB
MDRATDYGSVGRGFKSLSPRKSKTKEQTMYERENVRVWASDMEENTFQQATQAARMPFLGGPVALMPDAHWGSGTTVGSVLPTLGAIIPAAIGVDIGCGMAALKFDLTAEMLPDDLERLMPLIGTAIPSGNGKGGSHETGSNAAWKGQVHVKKAIGSPLSEISSRAAGKIIEQCGTLGGGNHFFEVCLDENDTVWIVLHSGSRFIGKDLAEKHIKVAKKLMSEAGEKLEDANLSYLTQNTPEFDAYISDMLWAQSYAALNREVMLDSSIKAFNNFIGREVPVAQRINCHHNFTQLEVHGGREMWITRKGAIKADVGDLGIIPGSMGTRSYIVEGRGNPESYNSCSHGAGRRFSRGRAKELFNSEDLAARMEGKVWNADRAASLVDEIPDAYKDIDQVMRDQADLVDTKFTLHQIFNYKG